MAWRARSRCAPSTAASRLSSSRTSCCWRCSPYSRRSRSGCRRLWALEVIRNAPRLRKSVIPLSILDLAPIIQGQTAAHALRNSLELVRHAERLGYTRYWVAEHHNMQGIASAATSVVIGYLAGGTSRIRVGAGRILLPNHAPLTIADQFGTLEALYSGRIDLALGRAPGTDQRTARALRRDWSDPDEFPRDVLDLQALLAPAEPDQPIVAVPGAGSQVPLWIPAPTPYPAPPPPPLPPPSP